MDPAIQVVTYSSRFMKKHMMAENVCIRLQDTPSYVSILTQDEDLQTSFGLLKVAFEKGARAQATRI